MTFTIITCSGVSSTGKLTTQTGVVLMHRSGGRIENCIAATRPTESLERIVKHADRLLVLDGCADCCAMKKLRALGIEADTHLIATDCGIEKNGMAEPRFDEIERLVAVVLGAIRR